MKAWLERTSTHQQYEVPSPPRRRLDAALWLHGDAERMDIALEWEWDNNKVHDQFPTGDFRKVLEVEASCGLAIVHTRANGKKVTLKAEQTLVRIRQALIKYRTDDRPVGLIEIRRTFQNISRVEFAWSFHDLDRNAVAEGGSLAYPLIY